MGLQDAQSTVMSILRGVAQADDTSRRLYLERFCLQYSQPLVDYLRYMRGVPLETAEDIVQEFWTVKLLTPAPAEHLIAKYLAKRADSSTLGFRKYLGRSIKNFYIDQARQRGMRGSPLSINALEGWEPQTPASEKDFDVVWASHILNDVVNTVREECERLGQLEMWRLFVRVTLGTNSDNQHPPSLALLAAEHGFETAKQASNALQTIARKFRRALRLRIADYLPTGDIADSDAAEREEIEQLLQILSQPGGVSVDILRIEQASSALPNGETTLHARSPSSASFRFENLMTSKGDYSALWPALLDNTIAEYLIESAMPCKPEWQRIKLFDLAKMSQPDLELLKLLRQRAKQVGAGGIGRAAACDIDDSIPMEFHAVLYLTAIAVARTQLGERITKSDDNDLKSRIVNALKYSWLDQRTVELFADLLATLR